MKEIEIVALGFKRLLRTADVLDPRGHTGAVSGVWPDLRFAYLNPAWFCFASENDAEADFAGRYGLGASILDAMSAPRLRRFYKQQYTLCLETSQVWLHEYECSSSRLYRWIHQAAYPLGDGEGLMIVNSPRIMRSHEDRHRVSHPADPTAYRNEMGQLFQCGHCRCSRNSTQPEGWDWVPGFVGRVEDVVLDSLCPSCSDYYLFLGAQN